MSSPATTLTTEVGHYENFPVASWLCPAAIRPAVVAIYHFARTADDLADEGHPTPAERLTALASYRNALDQCLSGPDPEQATGPWADVFGPLAQAVRSHRLPAQLLHDLLSAFEQDVRHTASGHRYADTEELLGYCRLSANPVGRLLLHLYGIDDPISLARSDQICSALQLINFWQDLSVDMPRGRYYLPDDALSQHGLTLEQVAGHLSPELQLRCAALVASLCTQARSLMLHGAPLALQVPGRAGWELRLVVEGGLRILDKIAAIEHRSWLQRPTISKADLPLMLWRAATARHLRQPKKAG